MPANHQDNAHCFKGIGLAYWRDKARGLQPRDSIPGPQGHRLTYVIDENDGFALQNGGIANPVMDILPPRRLIRFLAAGRDPASGLQGNWWLDLDAYPVIKSYALEQGIGVSAAAQRLLVVPNEWSDCGQILIAQPKVVLMCYRGAGKPVALRWGHSISPDGRRAPGTQVLAAPQGHNLQQIFIPGERQFLPDWLSLMSCQVAI